MDVDKKNLHNCVQIEGVGQCWWPPKAGHARPSPIDGSIPVWPFLARPLDGGGKENNFGFQRRLKKLV